jgi:hypothetical protein
VCLRGITTRRCFNRGLAETTATARHAAAPSPPRRRALLTLLTACALLVPFPAALLGPATAASVPRVAWSSSEVLLGEPARAVVAPGSRPRDSRLVLQRRHLDRWRTVDGSAVLRKRGWVLRVPTVQLGTFRYRVAAKRGGRVVSVSTTTPVTVRPPYTPAGTSGQHGFSTTPPVRWDPCRTIRWTFNPRHSPKRGLKQVRRGVRKVQQATGLDFVYVGRTSQRPTAYGTGLEGAHVVVGWRPARAYRPFTVNPKTVGAGGNTYYTGFVEADGTRVHRAYRGGVVLNASRKRDLANGYGAGFTWGEVIMHELGHVVGLRHPDARRQIMYYKVIPRRATWGAGDLAGLRRVGNHRGCLAPAGTLRSQGAQGAAVTPRVGHTLSHGTHVATHLGAHLGAPGDGAAPHRDARN